MKIIYFSLSLILILMISFNIVNAEVGYNMSITSFAGYTIHNYLSYAVVNTQAEIAAGRMFANCSDIKVRQNSTDVQYYWEDCNTTQTKIYALIQLVNGTNNYTIYWNISQTETQRNASILKNKLLNVTAPVSYYAGGLGFPNQQSPKIYGATMDSNKYGFIVNLTDSTTTVMSTLYPVSSAESATAVANNAMFVFGGDGPVNNIIKFNASDDSITNVSDLSVARRSACAAELDDQILVISGVNGGGVTGIIERFYPNNNTVSSFSGTLYRQRAGCMGFGDKAYLIGGYDQTSNPKSDIFLIYKNGTVIDTNKDINMSLAVDCGGYDSEYLDIIYCFAGYNGNKFNYIYEINVTNNIVSDPVVLNHSSLNNSYLRRVARLDKSLYISGGLATSTTNTFERFDMRIPATKVGEYGITDNTPPNVNWITPVNNSFINTSQINWDVVVSETPNTCMISINSSSNITMNYVDGHCYYNSTNLSNQTTYCARVWVNDSYGNMNVSSVVCATINLSANIYTCNSCNTCNQKIALAQPNDIVKMSANITENVLYCIDLKDKNNITFDCDYYWIIDSVNHYLDAVRMSNTTYVTLKNCFIKGWSQALRITATSFNSPDRPHHGIVSNIWLIDNWIGIAIENIDNFVFENIRSKGTDGDVVIDLWNSTNNIFRNITFSVEGDTDVFFIHTWSRYNTSTQGISNNNTFTEINILGPSKGNVYADAGTRLVFSNISGEFLIYNSNLTEGNSTILFNSTNGDTLGNGPWKFNITKTLGTNVIGGPYLGGNFWENYSLECSDNDDDGICASYFQFCNPSLYGGNCIFDWLPLALGKRTQKREWVNTNGTSSTNNYILINATINTTDNIPDCILEIDGNNITTGVINGSYFCSKNVTGLSAGMHTFRMWFHMTNEGYKPTNFLYYEVQTSGNESNNTIHISVYDEKNFEKIQNFTVSFISSSGIKNFGINSSYFNFIQTGYTSVLSPENVFDLLNTSFVTVYSYGVGNVSINGNIYIGDSENICLLWSYTTGGTNAVLFFYGKDKSNNWNYFYNISINNTVQGNNEVDCFEIPDQNNYGDNLNIKISISFTGSGERNLYIYEIFPETWNYSENKLSINISLLNLGENTIKIEDIENEYYERYYYLNITNSDIILDAYLPPKSSNVVQSIFLITNQYGAVISEAIINIQKLINGSYKTISNVKTDDAGTASFYLMENNPYRLLIMYGSSVLYYSFNALAQTYRITINESMAINISHLFDDIFIRISPSYVFINESDQNKTFSFLIASNTSSLTLYGMQVICNGTTILNTTNVTGSPSGGLIESNVDISDCSNITMKYYFQKSGYGLWVKSIVYTVVRSYGYGLWKALQLMKSNFSIDFEIFIFIICLIVIISALTIFGAEGSIIAGLISFGILTYIEPTLTGLFIVIAFASLALLVIKRRWL